MNLILFKNGNFSALFELTLTSADSCGEEADPAVLDDTPVTDEVGGESLSITIIDHDLQTAETGALFMFS